MNKELDLIDRNELYKQIRLYIDRHFLGETRVDNTLTVGEIASIISAMPAINAKIEESSKWEINEIEDRRYEYKCLNCGARHITRSLYHQKYCSNCGRHMDGGEN